MKSYIQWLIETELPIVDPHDDRDLIIGAFGAMKQFIPRIGEFGDSGKATGVVFDTNPELLVVWDNKRKLMFRGSNNCAACKNYNVRTGTCEKFEKPQVTQSFAFRHDIGGCVQLDFLPAFGIESWPHSKKYTGIQYAIQKGYIFRYANGNFDPKPIGGPFSLENEED